MTYYLRNSNRQYLSVHKYTSRCYKGHYILLHHEINDAQSYTSLEKTNQAVKKINHIDNTVEIIKMNEKIKSLYIKELNKLLFKVKKAAAQYNDFIEKNEKEVYTKDSFSLILDLSVHANRATERIKKLEVGENK
jgi:hypothetical protein